MREDALLFRLGDEQSRESAFEYILSDFEWTRSVIPGQSYYSCVLELKQESYVKEVQLNIAQIFEPLEAEVSDYYDFTERLERTMVSRAGVTTIPVNKTKIRKMTIRLYKNYSKIGVPSFRVKCVTIWGVPTEGVNRRELLADSGYRSEQFQISGITSLLNELDDIIAESNWRSRRLESGANLENSVASKPLVQISERTSSDPLGVWHQEFTKVAQQLEKSQARLSRVERQCASFAGDNAVLSSQVGDATASRRDAESKATTLEKSLNEYKDKSDALSKQLEKNRGITLQTTPACLVTLAASKEFLSKMVDSENLADPLQAANQPQAANQAQTSKNPQPLATNQPALSTGLKAFVQANPIGLDSDVEVSPKPNPLASQLQAQGMPGAPAEAPPKKKGGWFS